MENFKIYSTYDLKGNALTELEKIYNQTLKNVEALAQFKGAFSYLEKKLTNLSNSLTKLEKISTLSTGFTEFSGALDKSAWASARLTHNVSELSRGFTNLSKQSGLSNKRLKAFGEMKAPSMGMIGGIGLGMMGIGGPGMLAMGAAYGLYRGAKSGYETESQYEKIKVQMRASGLNEEQVSQAQKYTSNLNIKGVSQLQALEAFNDSWMATRKFQDAAVLTPTLSKAMLASHIALKDLTDEQEKNLIRFAELRSGGNLNKMQDALNIGYKMMNLSAGSLKPTELRTFMRMASGPASNMSELGLVSLEPIIQEMGGALTGTAVQSLTKQLGSHAGSMTGKESIRDLAKLGIYDKVVYGKNGKIISTHTSDQWYNLFQNDPAAFFMKLKEVYAEQGTNTPEEIDRRLGLDFPNNRGARFFRTIHKAQDKISTLRGEEPTIAGIDQSLIQSSASQMAASASLDASLNNLSKAFGSFISPTVISGMNALSTFLDGLTFTFNAISKLNNLVDPIKWIESLINTIAGVSKADIDPKKLANNMLSGNLSKQIIYGNANKSPLDTDKSLAHQILSGNISKQLIYGNTNKPAPQVTVINLDGKKIAEAVTKEQSKSMSSGGTMGSQTGFNTALDPSYFGSSYFGHSF